MIVAGIIVGVCAAAGLCATAAIVDKQGHWKSSDAWLFLIFSLWLVGSGVLLYNGGHRNGQIAALTGHATIELTAQADGTTQWTTKDTGAAR